MRGLLIPSQLRRVCDEYGLELGCAVLPDSTHTSCHDACGGFFFELLLSSAGLTVDLAPRHIFSMLIPASVLMSVVGAGG